MLSYYFAQNKNKKHYFEDSSSLPINPEIDLTPLESDTEKDLDREGFSAPQVSEILERMKEESVQEEEEAEHKPNFKRIYTEPLISTEIQNNSEKKVDQNTNLFHGNNQDMTSQSPNIEL
jgi:hypothetical protein